MMADNIARVIVAFICRIAYIFDAVCRIIRLDLAPRRSEQRADDIAAPRRYAAQALQAAAAGEIKQQRFGVIVCIMRCCYDIAAELFCSIGQKLIS